MRKERALPICPMIGNVRFAEPVKRCLNNSGFPLPSKIRIRGKEETLKRIILLFALLMLFFNCNTAVSADMSVNPEELTKIRFETPENAANKKYLGVSESFFTLADIDATLIVLQIFSMYCPICQAEAETVNQFYDKLNKSDKKRVKLMGIGTGNTPFEVDVFRKKYQVQFPLVPDDNFEVQKALSEKIRTPIFIVLKKQRGNRMKVVQVHVGRLTESDTFLNKVLEYAD